METFLWVEMYRPKDIESCVLPKNLKNINQDKIAEIIKKKQVTI